MAKIESYAPGAFCWSELATSDPEAAKRFYSEMFGWETLDLPVPNGVYTMFRKDDADVTACYQARPGIPTHWGLYFATESADASAEKAASLGGTVTVPPFDVMEVGRMAVIQDPQGVTFSVWQAKSHIGTTYNGQYGKLVWPEVYSTDPAATLAFYHGMFGWEPKAGTDVATAEYVELSHGGKPHGGMMPMRGDMWKGVPPHWMVYITVENIEDRIAKLKELGGSLCIGPHDIPHVGRFAVVSDAQGAMFSLIQMKGQVAGA